MTDELELYEEFFQKNRSYYLGKWVLFKAGRKYTFNAFAFLFGLFWFMYRRMYFEALVVAVFIFIEGYLESILIPEDNGQGTVKFLNILGTIVVGTVVGFLGNYFYLRKADKTIQYAKGKYSDIEQQKIYVKKKGGVSFYFLVVVLVLIILIYVFNNYLTSDGS